MVFGATAGATADDDVHLGLPPGRRKSSSADGPPLGNGRRRGRRREGGSAAAVPETVVLVLGEFQGVVVLDMGVVTVSLYYRRRGTENAERQATAVPACLQ